MYNPNKVSRIRRLTITVFLAHSDIKYLFEFFFTDVLPIPENIWQKKWDIAFISLVRNIRAARHGDAAETIS